MNFIKCSLPKELNVFYKYELNVSLKEMWITCIQDLWELQEIIVTKEEWLIQQCASPAVS